MKAFILVLIVNHIGSVAVTTVPTEFPSLESCKAAGAEFTKGTMTRFFSCIPSGNSP